MNSLESKSRDDVNYDCCCDYNVDYDCYYDCYDCYYCYYDDFNVDYDCYSEAPRGRHRHHLRQVDPLGRTRSACRRR